jgi:hypothetical protein
MMGARAIHELTRIRCGKDRDLDHLDAFGCVIVSSISDIIFHYCLKLNLTLQEVYIRNSIS